MPGIMDRRAFVAGAVGMFVMPLGARAPPARVPRIAILATTSSVAESVGPEPANPVMRAFVHRLRELGWTEGQTMAFEMRSAEGRPERYPEIAAEFVRRARDEGSAVHHWITLSARTSTAGGIVSPSALAVRRFTTSSNLVGCSTGMSAGFAPLRIRSTKTAPRR